jgi:hypothetical protein
MTAGGDYVNATTGSGSDADQAWMTFQEQTAKVMAEYEQRYELITKPSNGRNDRQPQ